MLGYSGSTAWLARAAFAATALFPLAASAQQHDPAAAQALFDQARALTQKGKYAEACPKLFESNRLDPGIGTQFHLADCYEKNGQIATAWATFLDVASLARSTNQPEREKVATKRAVALEGRLPRLTVNVAEESRVDGLEVKRDDVPVGTAQWGAPVPVDPGPHQLTVSAPGRKSIQRIITVEEHKPASYDVPVLELEPTSAAAAPLAATAPAVVAPPSKPPTVQAPAPQEQPKPQVNGKLDALPIALAAAGVVGLGVGSVFGLKARATNKDSKALCNSSNTNSCSADGVSKRNDALSQGNVATVGFIAGGALLAAAVVVWRVEAGSSPKPTAASRLRPNLVILPNSAALYLQGGF
ncbi:MAG: hypothetical protein ABUL62_05535 [Myxococcales bacterium]